MSNSHQKQIEAYEKSFLAQKWKYLKNEYGCNRLKQKEMYGLPDKNSDVLSDEIIDYIDRYFQGKSEDYSVFNMTDEPYIMFSIRFKVYDYFGIILNYDRGRFGCALDNGSIGISLKNSQKWYDKADMDVFCKELQEQLELRIPDKFLEYHGWK